MYCISQNYRTYVIEFDDYAFRFGEKCDKVFMKTPFMMLIRHQEVFLLIFILKFLIRMSQDSYLRMLGKSLNISPLVAVKRTVIMI